MPSIIFQSTLLFGNSIYSAGAKKYVCTFKPFVDIKKREKMAD